MAHFTETQCRRFRFVFNQYADDSQISFHATKTKPVIPRCHDTNNSTHLRAQPRNGAVENEQEGNGVMYDSFDDVQDGNVTAGVRDQVEAEEEDEQLLEMAVKRVTFGQTAIRITEKEMVQLLPRFGPPLPIEHVRQFVLTYDTSCTGTLDFEDFLEFLADYEVTLSHRRKLAKAEYKQRALEDEDFAFHFPEESAYILSLGLDDPEGFFFDETPLAPGIFSDILTAPSVMQNNAHIKYDPFTIHAMQKNGTKKLDMLMRKIVIRVILAKGLEGFLRPARMPDRGIAYRTINPSVTVRLNGMSSETTVRIDAVKPLWEQELTFDLSIPPADLSDLQVWIESRVIEFELNDYWVAGPGAISHSETILTGQIPLSRVLYSLHKPVNIQIPLRSTSAIAPGEFASDPLERARRAATLEVSLQDLTQERHCWQKVADACKSGDEVWWQQFPAKIELDLNQGLEDPAITGLTSHSSHRKKGLKRSTPVPGFHNQEYFSPKSLDFQRPSNGSLKSTLEISQYHHSLIQPLRYLYPRRRYHTLWLDETGTFRLGCALIQPLPFPRSAGYSDVSLEQAARAVSGIICRGYHLRVSDRTREWRHLVGIGAGSRIQQRVASNGAEVVDRDEFDEMGGGGFGASSVQWMRGWDYETGSLGVGIAVTQKSPIASPSTIISRGWATPTEHAFLLCGILLGLGLNAYVAIGRGFGRTAVFVITIETEKVNPKTLTRRLSVREATSHIPPNRYRRWDELESTRVSNSGKAIKFWDACTGNGFCITERCVPFTHLHTMFNHENIFFNIQKSDLFARPAFSWDLRNPKQWLPFLTSTTHRNFGRLRKAYAVPELLKGWEVLPMMDERAWLNTIAQGIRAYRHHVLLCPKTKFHRSVSRALQNLIPRYEARWRGEYIGGEPFDGISASRTEVCGWQKDLDKEMRESVVASLPDGTSFSGRMYRFLVMDEGQVIEQLTSLGALNCGSPDAIFAIAGKVYHRQFGAKSVWIGIGRITDLTAGDGWGLGIGTVQR